MNEIETKETLTSRHFWYVVFTIIFFVLFLFFLRSQGVVAMSVLLNISLFHFVILTLATFRITRLFVSDKTTQWLRDICVIVSCGTDPTTGLPSIIRTKRIKGVRRALGEILECPWCTGVWAAFLVVVLYVMALSYSFVAGLVLLFVFALAGGASLAQAVISMSLMQRATDEFPVSNDNKAPWDGQNRRATPNVCTSCGVQ